MIRTDDHQKIVDLARYATVPVINGLTDDSHPCQIMADLLTVMERRGGLAGIRWAWLGDGNNVLHSIIEAASLMDFSVSVGCPAGYDPSIEVVEARSEEHTSELQSLMRISYAVFCLKKN